MREFLSSAYQHPVFLHATHTHTHFFSLFPYVLHKISSDFLLTICEHYVLAVHVYSRSPKRMCTSVYYNENPSNVLLLLFVGFFLCVLVLLAARCVQSDLFLSCSFSLVLLVWLIPLDNFGVCVLKQCQRTHIMLTIALHARYMWVRAVKWILITLCLVSVTEFCSCILASLNFPKECFLLCSLAVNNNSNNNQNESKWICKLAPRAFGKKNEK